VKYLAIAALGLAVAGCGGSNFRPEQATAVQPTANLPAPGIADSRMAPADYRLGATDKISVRVYGAPDLSVDGAVDASGNITMPLIGHVPASGKTPAELADHIKAQLGERYLRDPQVLVSLTEALSQRVTLDGAVRNPGQYAIPGSVTLTQALAMGQGTTESARVDEVVVFRTIEGKRYAARFDLRAIRGGRSVDPAVYGNDVVVVGSSRTAGLLRDVASAAPLLGLFYLF
jgi:polysaccharide export outer membrane protein